MKKLFALALLGLLGWGALAVLESVHFSLYRLKTALDEGDVATVERHADLGVLSKAFVDMGSALAEEEARKAGGDLGGALASILLQALGPELGAALAKSSEDDVRRSIARKDLAKGVGPFAVHDGVSALGAIQSFDRTALVEVRGKCQGEEASMRLVLEKKDEGPVLGHPALWRVTGVEKASLLELAKACARGKQKQTPPAPNPSGR